MKEEELTQKKKELSLEINKLIIEFNKTLITIATSVLTAIIAYIVYKGIELAFINYLSISALILSIIFSFFGFGKAIPTNNDNTIRNNSILHTNISGFLLIIGIILLLTFRSYPPNNIDQILYRVEKTTVNLKYNLSQSNFRKLELNKGNYIIYYSIDNVSKKVVYSIKDNKIVAIN